MQKAYVPVDSNGERIPIACPVDCLYDQEGYSAGERRFASARQGEEADLAAAALTYSTEERATGGCWLDGKPVYVKTVQTTAPGSTVKYVPLGVSVETVVRLEGVLKDLDFGSCLPLPYFNPFGSLSGGIIINVNTAAVASNNNCLVVGSGARDFEGDTVWATIWYTKTTDRKEGAENG